MKPLSIKLQISLLASLLPVLVVLILSVVAYIEFEESVLGSIDATLESMAQGIRASFNQETSQDRLEAQFRAITGQDRPGVVTVFRIWADEDEASLFKGASRQHPDLDRLLTPPSDQQPYEGESAFFSLADRNDGQVMHTYRAVWMRYLYGQEMRNILVMQSSDFAHYELGEFLVVLLVVGASVTVLALMLVRLIVSWGLRAITQTGVRLTQVTYSTLERETQIMGEVPIELVPFRSALNDMLVRLNDALRQQTQLNADVAHELRTPLAIIQSSLEALRLLPRTTETYEEGIDDALEDVERLGQLITEILSLARLESKKSLPVPTEVNMTLLLQSLVEVFHDQAARRGTSILCDNIKGCFVLGDEMELRQLFSNLVDNAIRYGSPKSQVHISLQNEPDNQICVCLHNDGESIPPESLPHVFDRFYRVDASRSPASGGSGLGLAIAREIVQRHHGTIQITSDPENGTSVSVRLPCELKKGQRSGKSNTWKVIL